MTTLHWNHWRRFWRVYEIRRNQWMISDHNLSKSGITSVFILKLIDHESWQVNEKMFLKKLVDTFEVYTQENISLLHFLISQLHSNELSAVKWVKFKKVWEFKKKNHLRLLSRKMIKLKQAISVADWRSSSSFIVSRLMVKEEFAFLTFNLTTVTSLQNRRILSYGYIVSSLSVPPALSYLTASIARLKMIHSRLLIEWCLIMFTPIILI